ncbi:Hsp20/alpha crystallin family protein [Roseiarcaceae bacterium H3SJ34-1]|uniref:Hsp20/alpha crystallin family protein n=1 Tax=Terripilifer ovatus TaxID=3032367 RepID=UPI003AB98F30|nr:Hsp20/alpha crystallin family protein [Roseiarcaceae bacterium H3SJ34-1]
MTEATKLPIKTEAKVNTPSAPAAWMPLDNLRREIDRLFHNFNLGSQFPFGRGFEFELPQFRNGSLDLMPAVDVSEKDKAYEITAELPGMEEKDIEIKFSNGKLTIKGEKKEEKEERKKDYYLSERRFGSFVRSFQVPEGVDTSKIEASFAKGVLTVSLPKTTEAQKSEKTIAVKAA